MPVTDFIKHKSPTIVDKGYFEVIDNGDGTVTIAENQTFQIQDVIINTSDFSLTERTLAIPLGFNGQIRFSLCGYPVGGYDESGNIGKFYLAPRTDIYNHYTDLCLSIISRDATTGVITIKPNWITHRQYLAQPIHSIIIDGINGDDSNPGTYDAPIKTTDKLLNMMGAYSRVVVKFAPGTYTFTKQFPANNEYYLTSLDTTNPATIVNNSTSDQYTGLIRLLPFQTAYFLYLNIDCGTCPVVSGCGCYSTSFVYVEHCTITLNSQFGQVGSNCWPIVTFDTCTIIKPSTSLLWTLNALTLELIACTVQDGAGNPLTYSDIIAIYRDTTGTIKNFLSIHVT